MRIYVLPLSSHSSSGSSDSGEDVPDSSDSLCCPDLFRVDSFLLYWWKIAPLGCDCLWLDFVSAVNCVLCFNRSPKPAIRCESLSHLPFMATDFVDLCNMRSLECDNGTASQIVDDGDSLTSLMRSKFRSDEIIFSWSANNDCSSLLQ